MARTGKSSKATALSVAHSVFEGLAPLLTEVGITSPEAEALLRAVCVHAAARTLGTARRPNVSRVSVKTGVDRHTVEGAGADDRGQHRQAGHEVVVVRVARAAADRPDR